MKRSNRSRSSAAFAVGVAVVCLVGASLGHADSASASRKAPKPKKAGVVVVKKPKGKVPADFTMQFVQDAQAVNAGETASYTFDVFASASFAGAVIFDLPNLTDRFTGRVFSESSTRVRLEIAVPPNASTNSGVFTLRGRHGNITHEAVFRLNVTARPIAPTTTAVATAPTIAPQFTLSATDTTRTAGPGEQQQYGVSVNRSAGFTGPVDLHVDGLPTGATANFAPNPTTAGTVLYVTPNATTPSGAYLLSVVGQAGSTTRATAVQLIVRRTGDFTLGLAPTTVTVPAGNDAVAAVNVLPRAGSTSPAPDVTFTATGLPAGSGVLFDPNPSNGLTTVRVRTAASAPVGAYRVTINGTSGAFAHSIVLNVVVEKSAVGGFGIAASPQVATVAPGAETIYNVAISPSGGFSSTITFAVKSLPPFAIATVLSQTPTSATIKVSTGITTPTGSFPLQIAATAGNLSATVEVNLLVA